MKPVIHFVLAVSLALSISAVLPAVAFAAGPAASVSVPKGGMVFITNTGLEDVVTPSRSLRHANAAKVSGI